MNHALRIFCAVFTLSLWGWFVVVDADWKFALEHPIRDGIYAETISELSSLRPTLFWLSLTLTALCAVLAVIPRHSRGMIAPDSGPAPDG